MVFPFGVDHGDNDPFYDENYLAHAYAPGPGIGGDVHFNDNVHFTSTRGTNLFIVAAHEIGHALGLAHSHNVGALMYRSYSETDLRTFSLNRDDVHGIQSIYGPNPNVKPKPGKPDPTPPSTPDVCDPALVLDAVTTMRGEKMFFKGRFFWRSQSQSQPEQHPIKSFWPDLPDNIDAAYESALSDRLFIFKGLKVWAVSGHDLVPGYPKYLKDMGLLGIVKKVNAALYDEDSGKTLFFVGDKYYSYDENKKRMDKGFPKRVDKGFPGMTSKVTAAFQVHGFTYLFSGSAVFEYSFSTGRLFRVIGNNYFLPC
ncbi:hypothetical protein DPEC_G00356390 [Dallia pectoralis]|uniref:Uncharacterized protein n=1 Tax=Dallia pectoralis TaxID=75939 RepID=A0ACC2EZP6_DALPE|nr:hypothetical protein DPEC_G00356390 [Dallia pectoralis]